MVLASLGFTAILVFTGLVIFNQNEQNFIDVI
jgi:ABC-type polysaccharide/polyol phosphate export permease